MGLVSFTFRPGFSHEPSSKSSSRLESKQNDTVCVVVHDTIVVGPVTASSLPVARAFASERARVILQAEDSDKALVRICDCKEQVIYTSKAEPTDHDTVDDATETGFAAAAQMELEKFSDPQQDQRQEEDIEGEDSRTHDELETIVA
jgi:endoribonuclease Dicer